MKLIAITLLFYSTLSFSQLSFDELNPVNSPNLNPTVEKEETEKILRISPYQKIFIISDNSNYLNEGDYFSLVYKGELVGRFLAIKKKMGKTGIKLITLDNQDLFYHLRAGREIGLIKGDKPYTPKNQLKQEDPQSLDLESEVVSVKDILDEADKVAIEEDSKREIRTENIVSAAYGQVNSLDESGGKKGYTHWSLHWAHQFFDNIWTELSYGQSSMKSFPSSDTNSTLQQISIRAKYTLSAPLSSYIQPYLGIRLNKINAPEASSSMSEEEKSQEKGRIDSAEKKDLIFGATLLKRLVPGWFLKADIGIDNMNLGISFEF